MNEAAAEWMIVFVALNLYHLAISQQWPLTLKVADVQCTNAFFGSLLSMGLSNIALYPALHHAFGRGVVVLQRHLASRLVQERICLDKDFTWLLVG
jgi:hypothetical protein